MPKRTKTWVFWAICIGVRLLSVLRYFAQHTLMPGASTSQADLTTKEILSRQTFKWAVLHFLYRKCMTILLRNLITNWHWNHITIIMLVSSNSKEMVHNHSPVAIVRPGMHISDESCGTLLLVAAQWFQNPNFPIRAVFGPANFKSAVLFFGATYSENKKCSEIILYLILR